MKTGNLKRKQRVMKDSMATDADMFVLTFPTDITVDAKASLLAAMLFIDFTQFEGRASAATVGTVNAQNARTHEPLKVEIEERSWFPLCRWKNFYCCNAECDNGSLVTHR